MAKLFGITDDKYFLASVSRHDCRVLNGLMVDGGQEGLQGWAGYGRYSLGEGQRKVWAEVSQSFLDLYLDYQNRDPREFGVWKVKDVRFLEKEEIPDTGSVEWMADNWLWRTESGLVMLKDCSNEHLQAILQLDHVKPESNVAIIIKHILSCRDTSE